MAFEEHLLRKNYEEARNYALLCLNAYRKYKVWISLFNSDFFLLLFITLIRGHGLFQTPTSSLGVASKCVNQILPKRSTSPTNPVSGRFGSLRPLTA